MDPLAPLLGRTLVLVAHPDDESITCGALLQRMRVPLVVFATDGGPQDEYFWGRFGSRENYVALRKKEAEAALNAVGVQQLHWLADDQGRQFMDQHLFRNLPAAIEAVRRVVADFQPEAILTLAYEGGHPDHDSCNFLGRQVASELNLPIWEAPIYFRRGDDNVLLQEFRNPNGTEIEYTPTPGEFRRKLEMAKVYVSQKLTVTMFENNEREKFRPMAEYDYSRPPHEGQLNYEAWQWPIKGQEVADKFQELLHTQANPGGQR